MVWWQQFLLLRVLRQWDPTGFYQLVRVRKFGDLAKLVLVSRCEFYRLLDL